MWEQVFTSLSPGFAADEAVSARAPYVRSVPNGDPSAVTLDDGLEPRHARETGVIVARGLVGGATPADRTVIESVADEQGRPVFDLTSMEEKVRYLRISYEFSADPGQDAEDAP